MVGIDRRGFFVGRIRRGDGDPSGADEGGRGPVGPDHTRGVVAAGFDNPVFVRAGELLREPMALAPFQPGYGNAAAIDAVDVFASGDAAMMINGNGTLRIFRRWSGGHEHAAADIARLDFPGRRFADVWRSAGLGGARRRARACAQFRRGEAQTRSAELGFGIPSIAGADAAVVDKLQRHIASELTRSTDQQLFYDQELGPRLATRSTTP